MAKCVKCGHDMDYHGQDGCHYVHKNKYCTCHRSEQHQCGEVPLHRVRLTWWMPTPEGDVIVQKCPHCGMSLQDYVREN